MSGTRAVRVAGRVAVAGVLTVVAAVVLLMSAPLFWRQVIESAATYQDLLDVLGPSNAVSSALVLLALAGLATVVAGLSVAIYQARRLAGGLPWRPVWALLGGLAAVAVVTATTLVVGSGPGRKEVTLLLGGDSLDPAARSAFERLYPLPSPPEVVLGLALLAAAVFLVVALVRRLGRVAG